MSGDDLWLLELVSAQRPSNELLLFASLLVALGSLDLSAGESGTKWTDENRWNADLDPFNIV
ncbi:hypothetical protein Ptr902_07892 [Pyrenophora tritici-repentis]|nr:hypothetical protein Ptr902_07892 [Pyrenophora tritici-repentis]